MLKIDPVGPKVYLSEALLFDGEVYKAEAIVSLKDFHGHFQIRTKFKEKHRLIGEWINPVCESPICLRVSAKDCNSLIIKLKAFEKECIYGGGEQYSLLNLKGKRLPIFVQEQGVGRGWNLISLLAATKSVRGNWHTTYFPQPVFFSTAGYGVIINTDALVIADFRRRDETVFEVYDRTCELIFLEGTVEQMVRQFHDYYSQSVEFEDWVFGVWIASQGGVEKAEDVIRICEKNGIPLTVLWCQDWCGKNPTKFGRQVYWNWSYDRQDYHDLPQYIERWREKGIHFLGYINPFMIKGGSLYSEALKNGYLVRNKNGEPYDIYVTTFPAGMIDLTNLEAFEWYKTIIKENMIGIGMSGWMADFGEYLPADAQLKVASGFKYHNRYVVDWAKLNYEAVSESKGSIVFFMRAGYLNSTRYTPVYWAGDQNVDWSKSDGLASVVPAMLSMGMCGVKLSHFDVGGYTSLMWLKRTPELFMRWSEIAAFSPIMRTHQTNRPSRNLQFDQDPMVLRHFSRMARVHLLLRDYLKDQLRKANVEKMPLIRHLVLSYPDNEVCKRIQYQYLLGEDLMIAPVLKPRVDRWKVYLPDGRWIHLWTGNKFKAGWSVVEAQLGFIPVFVREDSTFAQDLVTKVRDVS